MALPESCPILVAVVDENLTRTSELMANRTYHRHFGVSTKTGSPKIDEDTAPCVTGRTPVAHESLAQQVALSAPTFQARNVNDSSLFAPGETCSGNHTVAGRSAAR